VVCESRYFKVALLSFETFQLRKPALGLAAAVSGKWPFQLRMIFLADFKPYPLKKLQKEINQEKVVARDKSRLASVNRWSVGFAFLLYWFSWFKVLCAYDKIRYAKKRSSALPFW